MRQYRDTGRRPEARVALEIAARMLHEMGMARWQPEAIAE